MRRVSLFYLLIFTTSGFTGDGFWTWVGPVPGNVTAMHITQQFLFIGIENIGLFRYDLNSYNWDTLNAPGNPIDAIYTYPGDSDILLVGLDVTTTHSLWKSTDGGITWAPSDSGISAPGISDYLPIRDIKGKLGSSDTVFVATDDGVWMSPDFGSTWEYVFSDDPDLLLFGYNINSTSPDTIYLGARSLIMEGQIYRSIDGGLTWDFLWGTYSVGGEGIVTGVAPHPDDPNLLLASVGGYFVPGIYKSVDGGVNFYQTYGFPSSSVRYHTVDSLLAYAGTYQNGSLKSIDAGSTWFYINDSLPLLQFNDFLISTDNRTLFAGTPTGVFEYTDIEVKVPESEHRLYSPGLIISPNPTSGLIRLSLEGYTPYWIEILNVGAGPSTEKGLNIFVGLRLT